VFGANRSLKLTRLAGMNSSSTGCLRACTVEAQSLHREPETKWQPLGTCPRQKGMEFDSLSAYLADFVSGDKSGRGIGSSGDPMGLIHSPRTI